jgi:hypothetical protein
MDLAPSLYPLAWRKKRLVRDDVTNHNWTRGLWRMESAKQMAEFIHLWDLVQQAQLSNQGNRIEWKWTANGKYSDKLAYLIQFRGSYCTFNAKSISKAHAEGKHIFFYLAPCSGKGSNWQQFGQAELALQHCVCLNVSM